MAKSSTTLKKGDNLPSRGKGKRNLILEAIKERALLGLSDTSTKEDAERAVFGFLAEAAFNPSEDNALVSNTCLNQLMKKGWPDVKPIMPMVEFDLGDSVSHIDKASKILEAVSKGDISPDVANMLISSISSMIKIAEVTDIEERIKRLEGLDDEVI